MKKSITQIILDKMNGIDQEIAKEKAKPKKAEAPLFEQHELDAFADKKALMMECLRTGVARIEYTKVNGEADVITATLDPALIPPSQGEETPAAQRTPKPYLLAFYSPDRGAWRSVRIDKMKSIEAVT